ncbi:zn-dependent carboxypeptidase [Staphylococcus sp. CAG:324]|jgi:Zn-dependent carboxypeptidase|nr:carboxypeptidase M32 [Staphylococcus sp.]CDC71442.1 zn-dependent carboxypeptidase [Staphylococcus sp. CAG:324]
MENALEIYQKARKKLNAFHYAMYLISWDSETEAPVGCLEERSKQIGELVSMMLEISHCKEYVEAVKTLYDKKEELTTDLKLEIVKVWEELEKELKIPEAELIEYEMLLAKANNIWCEAKLNNNYALFAPVLAQIINWQKKYIQYLETDTLKGYDVLLNDYEKGFTKKEYDEFFDLLKKELVPFVKKITSLKPLDDSFVYKKYSIDKQKEFAHYLMDVMCFDKKFGLTKESEHPFTSGYGTTDVRVTCHYYENLLTSSIFSMIHELGHATYERQCDSKYDDTALSGGTTMAMHESQSRFYENIVGRSYPFWSKHYPVLQQLFFENLHDVELDDFYHAINKIEKTLIRTEADELTYPLHIMVRYDIEKAIIESNLNVHALPKLWNKLYQDYLGIEVPNDTKGILQDVHWAGGSFGYFPTYALGSAYAAQLYHQMKKELNIDEAFGADDLSKVNAWLKEKVHKYAGSKSPKEILLMVTHEEFNPKYYLEYLKEKYSKIYQLTNE